MKIFTVVMITALYSMNAWAQEQPQQIRNEDLSKNATEAVPKDMEPGACVVINPISPPQKGPVCRVTIEGVGKGACAIGNPGAAFQMLIGWDPIGGGTNPIIHAKDCEHIWLGSVTMDNMEIKSAPDYPLTCKWTEDLGYVYLCGKGEITMVGKTIRLGYRDSVELEINRLKSDKQLEREGAAQAIGWLAKKQESKEIAVPALIAAAGDTSAEVRRSVAEALGRIGDEKAKPALLLLADANKETDEWVRNVAEESLKRIAGEIDSDWYSSADSGEIVKNALESETNGDKVAKLLSLVNHKNADVRAKALTALGEIDDPRSVEALVKVLNEDSDLNNRLYAIESLAKIKSYEAIEAIINSLGQESDHIKLMAVVELKKITGVDFRADFSEWQAWWQKNKEQFRK